MSRCRQRWAWKLGLGSWLAIGGVIAPFGNCGKAQPIADDTLGASGSVVTPSVLIRGLSSDRIDGGAIRGTNLFHSFREFNIDEARGAYFTNPAGIKNILSRVTGGSRSDIRGTLGVLGNANLFLINPNGIIFGPNASLDVGGSFVATTANAVQFDNQGFFSASEPNSPPLLTIKPSAFIFNQIATQPINSIENRAFLLVPDGRSLLLVGGNVSPNVASTGGILIDGKIFLEALGGRIELGGVTGSATVGLNVEGDNLSLSFPNGVSLADVSLTNGAFLSVYGGGGSIAINARNLNILQGSRLFAGIESGRGSVNTQAGDITLNATGIITVAGSRNVSSRILNILDEGAVGKGGNINIKAGSLSLDNTILGTLTNGSGNAGSVSVQVDDRVSLANSSLTSSVLEEAVGNGGNIEIQARSLSLTDKGSLDAFSVGQGNAGNVLIQASNSVSLVNSDISSSILGDFLAVEQGAVRKGGDINILTGSLSLNYEAVLDASTYGLGDAGSVSVRASDSISVANSSIGSEVGEQAVGNGSDINIEARSLSLTDEAVLSTNIFGRGNAGSISVRTSDSVSAANSSISSYVGEQAVGNGGDINIQARSLSLTDGVGLDDATVSTSSFGWGNAGSVSVRVSDSVSLANSSIDSNLLPGSVGKGGNIDIQARSLSLTDNATLSTSTSGQGDAGSVLIQVIDSFSVVDSDISSSNYGKLLSIIGAEGEVAVGKGGDISILTGSLSLSDNAGLSTSTYGQGDAGSVFIRASGPVSFTSGSAVLSAVTSSAFLNFVGPEAVGKEGNVSILAESLSLDDAALITATAGQGNAGNIFVRAADFVALTNNSLITSAVERGAVGNGGDIDLQTRSLSLTSGSQLRAAVENQLNNLPGGRGEGGTIQVNASDSVELSGVGSDGRSSGLLTITEQGASGQAGDITVNTGGFRIADGAVLSAQTLNFSDGGTITINANTFEAANGGQVLTTTYDVGKAGNITVNASDSVTLSGRDPTFAARVAQFGGANNQGSASGLFAGTQSAGTAGNLKIQTGQLIVRDGAQVSASTAGRGTGGTLEVTAPQGLVELIGSSSGLFAQSTAAGGSAGNLTITTGQLQVLDGAEVTVSGESGIAGNLTATADSIRLDQGKLTAVTGKGSGGNIGLSMQDLLLMRDNSLISAEALGTANGGNINIDTDFIVAIPSKNSDISANAEEARGGRVMIDAQGIFGTEFRERENPATSDITATSELGPEFSGTVEINTPDVDPSSGLVNLPVVPVDIEVAQGCTGGSSLARSEFIITGRGGLPPNPGEALNTDAVQVDLVTLNPQVAQPSTRAVSTSPTNHTSTPIVEAQGWVIDKNGEVILTANVPIVTPHSSWQSPAGCHAPRNSS